MPHSPYVQEVKIFGQFAVNLTARTLLKNDVLVGVEPKPFAMLEILLREPGRVVPYGEFKAEVWPDVLVVVNQNVNTQVNKLRKALGESAQSAVYILTKHGEGYQFNPGVDVKAELINSERVDPPVIPKDHATVPPVLDQEQTERKHPVNPRTRFKFAGHGQFVLLASGLHGLLSGEAVILEIAYQFSRLGRSGLSVALAAFFWTFVTSCLALTVDRRRTRSKASGMGVIMLMTYGSAMVLQLTLHQFLPSAAVTELTGRQPQSAQAAYLKNIVLYFLPLITAYVLIPYHFVMALQREMQAGEDRSVLALLTAQPRGVVPRSAIYLRVWWLALGLMLAGVVSVFLTQDLFDHLRPSRYMSVFMELALGRCLLFFGLGLLCLVWYAKALNEIKRECIKNGLNE